MQSNLEKNIKEKTKIMIFGTFDIVHRGHLNFFKQARELAKHAFLVVSIARDKNVKKIKSKKPKNSEKQRLKQVAESKSVDKAVLGGVNKYLSHIVKESPDIIALGYDQTAYVKTLKKDLKSAGLKTKVVRLNPYKEHIYKTSLILK